MASSSPSTENHLSVWATQQFRGSLPTTSPSSVTNRHNKVYYTTLVDCGLSYHKLFSFHSSASCRLHEDRINDIKALMAEINEKKAYEDESSHHCNTTSATVSSQVGTMLLHYIILVQDLKDKWGANYVPLDVRNSCNKVQTYLGVPVTEFGPDTNFFLTVAGPTDQEVSSNPEAYWRFIHRINDHQSATANDMSGFIGRHVAADLIDMAAYHIDAVECTPDTQCEFIRRHYARRFHRHLLARYVPLQICAPGATSKELRKLVRRAMFLRLVPPPSLTRSPLPTPSRSYDLRAQHLYTISTATDDVAPPEWRSNLTISGSSVSVDTTGHLGRHVDNVQNLVLGAPGIHVQLFNPNGEFVTARHASHNADDDHQRFRVVRSFRICLP